MIAECVAKVRVIYRACQEVQQGFKEKFSKKTKNDEALIRDCNVPISDGAADTLRRVATIQVMWTATSPEISDLNSPGQPKSESSTALITRQ